MPGFILTGGACGCPPTEAIPEVNDYTNPLTLTEDDCLWNADTPVQVQLANPAALISGAPGPNPVCAWNVISDPYGFWTPPSSCSLVVPAGCAGDYAIMASKRYDVAVGATPTYISIDNILYDGPYSPAVPSGGLPQIVDDHQTVLTHLNVGQAIAYLVTAPGLTVSVWLTLVRVMPD